MTESLNLIPWRITRKGLMQEWGFAETPELAWVDAMECMSMMIQGDHECPEDLESCPECEAQIGDLLLQIGDACRD